MKAHFEADGDVIVITGGANGIGRALALAAANAGACVVVCDVDQAALETLVEEDSRIVARRLDVADRDGVLQTFARIEQEYGRIDGLVCGAAVQPRTRVDAMDPAEWQRVLNINLNGVVWCCQAAIPGRGAGPREAVDVRGP